MRSERTRHTTRRASWKVGEHRPVIYGLRKVNTTGIYFTGFRSWLQHKFKLGIPIFFGRSGVPFGLVPKKDIKIGLEVGGISFSGPS
jgi:hypothetical protein